MHSAMGDGTVKKGVRLPLWGRVALAAGVCALVACPFLRSGRDHPHAAMPDTSTSGTSGDTQELLVTGYCNCGKCCGWRKKWFLFGEPVYNYGKMKGSPKKVGVTASGTVATRGTIAADPSVYPFGTKIEVPGYGTGTVQDIGGAIKGAHIDLWFPTHEDAIAWGAKKLKVKVEKAKAQPEKPKIQAERQKPGKNAEKAKK